MIEAPAPTVAAPIAYTVGIYPYGDSPQERTYTFTSAVDAACFAAAINAHPQSDFLSGGAGVVLTAPLHYDTLAGALAEIDALIGADEDDEADTEPVEL